MPDWILKVDRPRLGIHDQNFLLRSNSIYIMDNHRGALWCCSQHIHQSKNIGVIHIVAHYDTACLDALDLKTELPLNSIQFEDFLELKSSRIEVPLISWDNYLYYFHYFHYFHYFYRNSISKIYFATHNLPVENRLQEHVSEIDYNNLPKLLERVCKSDDDIQWILNIDLDYFIDQDTKEPCDGMNSEYRSLVFRKIKDLVDSGKVLCSTYALSPKCCGGWLSSYELCEELC